MVTLTENGEVELKTKNNYNVMRKKKVLLKNELSEIVFIDRKVKVSKNDTEWFFEIGNRIGSRKKDLR